MNEHVRNGLMIASIAVAVIGVITLLYPSNLVGQFIRQSTGVPAKSLSGASLIIAVLLGGSAYLAHRQVENKS